MPTSVPMPPVRAVRKTPLKLTESAPTVIVNGVPPAEYVGVDVVMA